MPESKFIISKNMLTEKANRAEMEFRNSQKQEYIDYANNFQTHTNDGKLEYLPFIQNSMRIGGKVLEIGAGICWFSSELSKIDEVNEIYSLEFSKYLIKDIAPMIMKVLNANEGKITRVQGDFNALPFDDGTFDFVVIDAALHHATDLKQVLGEISRVLKQEGRMIAIREPVLPTWRPWCKAHFGEEDKSHGITENIYSMKEWKSGISGSGLEFSAIPFMPKPTLYRRLLQPLMILNNQLLGHYILTGRKL